MSVRGPGFAPAAALAAVIIALDQTSKALVRGGLTPGDRVDLFAGVDLVRVANRGIAFGLLDDAGSLVLALAALAFAALLAFFLASEDRPGLWIPIGLLAGGAIGNLIDRVREGFVTDFIDPPGWPAFNVADIAITIGVLILLAIYVFGKEPERGPPAAERESGEGA